LWTEEEEEEEEDKEEEEEECCSTYDPHRRLPLQVKPARVQRKTRDNIGVGL
jgi:hypothetical protein